MANASGLPGNELIAYSRPDLPPPSPRPLRRSAVRRQQESSSSEEGYYREPLPSGYFPEREPVGDAVIPRGKEAKHNAARPPHYEDGSAYQDHRRTRKRGLMYDLGTVSKKPSDHDSARGKPDPPEWREPEHKLPDGSVTQLLSIHSAEHKTFQDDKERIILTFPDPSKGVDTQHSSSVKLRWL